ncbi:MAG: hypothetical protein Tsb0018_01050 [Opitutales bacterium]
MVLDAKGVILHHQANAHDCIGYPEANLTGKTLNEVLFAIHPHWTEFLTEETPPENGFLPWEDSQKQHAFGLSIQTLHLNEHFYVTLAPALAPRDTLRNASLLDIPLDTETVSQLFLRLQTAESRMETYMHHFPGIFFSQRADLSFSYLGPQFESTFGINPNRIQRSSHEFLQLITEKDLPIFLSKLEKHSSNASTFNITYRLKHPTENSIHHFLDVRTPILSPAGLLLGYEGVWLDITRQTIAENRLTRSVWKENIATLTRGLIHDFSNIMAGIHSISELYGDSINKEHDWYGGIHQIKKSSREAQQIVRRIIDLNREVPGKRGYHNLETLTREQAELIEMILPRNIKITVKSSGEELPVHLDDVQYRQTLLNLAINARDAMEEYGGTIEISLSSIHSGDFFGKNEQAPQNGALICIKDNGCGIEEKHLTKIFAPFFTTKETGKGSGFGLYNTKIFIEENKGIIDIESTPNQGSCFYIYLPLTNFDEDIQSEPAQDKRPQIAVYADQDAEDFDIVKNLRESHFEVITFQEKEKLVRHLKENDLFPASSTVLLIDIGESSSIQETLVTLQSHHPKGKYILQSQSHALEMLPNTFSENIHLILDESISPGNALKKIQKLIERDV